MNPMKLYTPVEFPVPRGTPMLSSVVSEAWDHSVEWNIPRYEDFESVSGASADTTFEVDATEDSPDSYLMDHTVDGRELFPGVGSLVLAWKTLANMKGVNFEDLPVQLTNVQIHQAMFLRTTGAATISVSIMPRTGEFQVCEGESLLASGVVRAPEGHILQTDQYSRKNSSVDDRLSSHVLTSDEVYREFIIRGYEYGPYFQGIQRATLDGLDADLRWDGRWISYLDTVLQMIILSMPGFDQVLPISFDCVNIDPTLHPDASPEDLVPIILPGHFDPILGIASAGGVEIRGAHTILSSRRLTHTPPNIEEYCWLPYCDATPGEQTSAVVSADLRSYADALLEFTQMNIKRWLDADWQGALPNRERLQKALDLAQKAAYKSGDVTAAKSNVEMMLRRRNGHKAEKLDVFDILNIAYTESMVGDFGDSLRGKFHENRFGIWDDPMVSAIETDDVAKHCLETVAENVTTGVMEILEPGAGQSFYYRSAFAKALNHFSVKDFRYTLANTGFAEDAKDYDIRNVHFDPYDPSTFPASQDGLYDLVVLKWMLHPQYDLDLAFQGYSNMIKPGGFILVQEFVDCLSPLFFIRSTVQPTIGGKDAAEGERILGCYYTDAQWQTFFSRHNFEIVLHRQDQLSSSLFLLRKRFDPNTSPMIVYMDDLKASWLEEVKAKFAKLQDAPEDARLWLVARSQASGIMGFYTVLRWETGSDRVRCVQVLNHKAGSTTPRFTADSPEFKELIRKDLAYNIYRDGRWGSYRGLLVSDDVRLSERPREHVFANWLTASDTSSLRWFDSPLALTTQNLKLGFKPQQYQDRCECSVYYAAVNTRDVLLANGSVKRDDLPEGMLHKESVLGVEFSGTDVLGKKVMGLCSPPALASTVQCPRSALWTVPDTWSLEEAATVPLAYSLAYYALVSTGRVRQGETVLVHSGASSVGQAAIAIALSKGCTVFTLTKNKDETAALKAKFHLLKDVHICSSEDGFFEKRIKVHTSNKGVNLVLNTMSGTSLQASHRLLAKHGRFLDIRYTAGSDEHFLMASKDRSYAWLQLDNLIDSQGPEWAELRDLVQEGINRGVVKPLRRNVFKVGQLVDAFKATDESSGVSKVLIKMREGKSSQGPAAKTTYPSVFHTNFHPDKSYVLVGGLGGMGLEIAHWMITRGARKVLLTSRSGITNGYQARKINFLRELGADVEVVPINVNTEEKANVLINLAANMGPVGGLFNLATALHDNNLVDQTEETFIRALESKITTTQLLDQVSRERSVMESLDHFVMFSSLVATHGHIGQTNYAFGNSALERLCERRRLEGLPAFVVQWGSIADVGIVAAKGNDVVICGKWPQRLFNVIATFDYMLSQQDRLIMCSYVIADKSSAVDGGDENVAAQICKAVGKVLGIKDVTTVDGDKEFLDLGMDSLMGVEIKQMLEREASVVVNTKDIQLLTFHSLTALVEAGGA